MKIGKVSESVLKRSVLKHIKNNHTEIASGAGVGVDCAVFASGNDSYVSACTQAAVVMDSEDVLYLIHKAVNNLACTCALPKAALLTVTLPESAQEETLKYFMQVSARICKELQMDILGGHTMVTDKVLASLISITALGNASKNTSLLPGGAKPGQDVVVSKWIGLEGTARIAEHQKDQLLTRYPEHLVETAISFKTYLSILPEVATAGVSNISAMHDVSEGGIFRALWELAECAGVGLTIDLKKLPVRQETVEVCEFFGISPYELAGGGSLVMTVEDGEALVRELEHAGIPATVVGKITDSHDRTVTNEGEIRFLERPKTDELYKIAELFEK